MYACVRLRRDDGGVVSVGPGEIIGRSSVASLRLDDPAVSEAHALVSLRGERLRLLSLRGRFLVDGEAALEVDLAAGQRIRFSPDTEVWVDEVVLPDVVLAVEAEGLPRQVLSGPCAVFAGPPARLVAGADPAADALVWSTGEGWRVRVLGVTTDFEPGDSFVAAGLVVHGVGVSLAHAGQSRTRLGLDGPLRIVAHFDSVQLVRDGQPTVVLSGLHARLLSELVAVGQPMGWEALAADLWPHETDRESLRRRWDVCLSKLRARLRDAGVRPDLLHASRTGHVALVLGGQDVVEDRT